MEVGDRVLLANEEECWESAIHVVFELNEGSRTLSSMSDSLDSAAESETVMGVSLDSAEYRTRAWMLGLLSCHPVM